VADEVTGAPSAPSDEPPLGEPVAHASHAEALEDAVLLLSALGITHEVVDDERGGVALLVEDSQVERARAELAAADRAASTTHEPRLRGGARAGIPIAIALLLGHLALHFVPAARRAAIYAAGELDSAQVRAGEVERVVTALFLHADFAHVVGDALATAIFVSAVGDFIGPGLALLFCVAAGVAGNLFAVLIDPGHLAIGFSTATFGALGLVAVLGFVARYHDRIARKRAWLTLGAGVSLLALLGAGERSDLLAHLAGLGAGALLGASISPTLRRGHGALLDRGLVQALAVALTIVVVLAAALAARAHAS
jgi:membrane associated rhomboid family serine protease